MTNTRVYTIAYVGTDGRKTITSAPVREDLLAVIDRVEVRVRTEGFAEAFVRTPDTTYRVRPRVPFATAA